ncbi:hypothetical protein APX70_200233 [Pseudomonas syringae pv. maculicola]|uniref:Uncharacterized protein n=1 Tax=Pseudomonas syringae pv. maculicola TaxID=59511 RepID=A0A3M3AS89_PSEYM|nr:hypothetical protein APX70_200233 [Pseudomonas syringae pv. maculicola]
MSTLSRAGILVYIPITVPRRASDGHISQPQDFIFLCRVKRLKIVRITQPCQPVDLILVRRDGQVLTIAQQEHGIGLQALGAVIG